jgi:elongation factor G
MGDAPLIVEIAVEPKDRADAVRLEKALRELSSGTPDIGVSVDRESGQSIIGARGMRALEAAIARLKELVPFECNIGAPQVAYRETLSRPTTIRYTHKRALGGKGQYADVTLAFEPLPPGSGIVFENGVADLPAEFVLAIEKGVRVQAGSGLLAGFPVIDFKVRLVGGSYHEVDSSVFAFDIAARAAFRELATKSVVVLLEPVMRVEVVTPDDVVGGPIGDINSRRGRVESTEDFGGGKTIIVATVPLSNLFGYENSLAVITRGEATCNVSFHRYEIAPTGDGGDDTFPAAMALRA